MADILTEKELNSIAKELIKVHGERIDFGYFEGMPEMNYISLILDDNIHVMFDFEDYTGRFDSSFEITFDE